MDAITFTTRTDVEQYVRDTFGFADPYEQRDIVDEMLNDAKQVNVIWGDDWGNVCEWMTLYRADEICAKHQECRESHRRNLRKKLESFKFTA
jgi:hypothetical protein